MAQVVEAWRGPKRYDLFGIGDVLLLDLATGHKVLIQAYMDTRAERLKHAGMDLSHPTVRAWCLGGDTFVHEVWKRVKPRGKRMRWVCRRTSFSLWSTGKPCVSVDTEPAAGGEQISPHPRAPGSRP